MSEELPIHVLKTILARFSTDEFYLWTVKRDRSSDTYTFNFSHNDFSGVVITATGEELRSYRKPEYVMQKALRFALSTGRLMGGRDSTFRMSELVAAMPLAKQPARLAHSLPKFAGMNGPTEAMLEANYRV